MKEAQGAHSGGGMDREVASRKLSPKTKIALGAGGLVLLLALFWYFMPASNSQTVDTARLTISPVTEGRFDDFDGRMNTGDEVLHHRPVLCRHPPAQDDPGDATRIDDGRTR